MSADELTSAKERLAEVRSRLLGADWLLYDVLDMLIDEAGEVSDEELAESRGQLGELDASLLDAFDLVASVVRPRYEARIQGYERAIRLHGADAVGLMQDDWPARELMAFMDAEMRLEQPSRVPAPPASVSTVSRRPRARAVRSRRLRRSSRGSPGRPDDDLADLARRCPRCGGALRALLPSPHWTCDPCAAALWERQVAHDLPRVIAEAERITRGAA